MEVSRTGQWTGIGEPVPPRPPLLRSLGKARDSIRGQSNSRPPPPCLRAACIPACVHLCVRFTLNPEGSGLDVHPFLCFRCPQFGILFFSVFSLQLTLSLFLFPFVFFWGGSFYCVCFLLPTPPSAVRPTRSYTVVSGETYSLMSSIWVGKTYLGLSLNLFVPK